MPQYLTIAPNLESGTLKTTTNQQIDFFIDALEHHAAIDTGCNMTITEDTTDFWFSEIEILDCEGVINKLTNFPK